MQVNLDAKIVPNFNAKVSPKFLNAMQGFVNNGENRLRNNYRLGNKIQEYATFGYENYTIQLLQKYQKASKEYYLIAVKDGDSTGDGIFLAKRHTFRQVAEKFLSIRKREFDVLMKKKNIFHSK